MRSLEAPLLRQPAGWPSTKGVPTPQHQCRPATLHFRGGGKRDEPVSDTPLKQESALKLTIPAHLILGATSPEVSKGKARGWGYPRPGLGQEC